VLSPTGLHLRRLRDVVPRIAVDQVVALGLAIALGPVLLLDVGVGLRLPPVLLPASAVFGPAPVLRSHWLPVLVAVRHDGDGVGTGLGRRLLLGKAFGRVG
jgi:hypothetical protein